MQDISPACAYCTRMNARLIRFKLHIKEFILHQNGFILKINEPIHNINESILHKNEPIHEKNELFYVKFVPVFLLFLCVCVGCGHKNGDNEAVSNAPLSAHDAALAANKAFLSQKTYDPWILTSTDPHHTIDAYIGGGSQNFLIGAANKPVMSFGAGDYINGQLRSSPLPDSETLPPGALSDYRQMLNLHTGEVLLGNSNPNVRRLPQTHWETLWNASDIVINGDAQAQQVTHANLFYLISSTFPGSTFSIPPMGLSSAVYGGHIFWDADVWMLPALICQHPDYAKPIVDYRFKLLAQAKANAAAHHLPGAEFPWESADTGKEEAPAEFARERHITADVAFAAWNYYLWTGDRHYLETEGWPLLKGTADYWAARVTEGPPVPPILGGGSSKAHAGQHLPPKLGGQGGLFSYHIKQVLSPDETAGLVDDDAYTNAVVKLNLLNAARAAALLNKPANPKWAQIADGLVIPYDKARQITQENAAPMSERFAAKQADVLLLLHPLGFSYDAATTGRMLDFYSAHTIANGPAMTVSMESIVAARLNRGQMSLDLFHNSYQPFMRAPWDAFSEKRTTNNVYFLTGMAGCLQSVLYGFAGLNAHVSGEGGAGKKIAGDGVASLFCDPHLPPGWTELTVKGVKFRGKTLTVTIKPGNILTVSGAK